MKLTNINHQGMGRLAVLIGSVGLLACGLYDRTDFNPQDETGGSDTSVTAGDTFDTGTDSTAGADTTDTGDGGDEFAFDPAPADDFDEQVDRLGMPAVGTAVITDKEGYNAASPIDDANEDFVPEIVENVTALHDALDESIEDADFEPCAPDDCIAQAGPLVIPDVLKHDLEADAGFPNGRLLTDPVMDVTLAVVLLDLEEQEVTDLVGVLNPEENDVDFEDDFPYLAPPAEEGDDEDTGDEEDTGDDTED